MFSAADTSEFALFYVITPAPPHIHTMNTCVIGHDRDARGALNGLAAQLLIGAGAYATETSTRAAENWPAPPARYGACGIVKFRGDVAIRELVIDGVIGNGSHLHVRVSYDGSTMGVFEAHAHVAVDGAMDFRLVLPHDMIASKVALEFHSSVNVNELVIMPLTARNTCIHVREYRAKVAELAVAWLPRGHIDRRPPVLPIAW